MWQSAKLLKDKHCFFGREGGVSKGKYSGLNVNTKSLDNVADLEKNLEIAAAKVGLKKENLVLLNQGVSNKAVFIDYASRDFVEADGTVCKKRGIGLCIRTADCTPILFEDRKNNIIGAAHAGWRGAFKGIISNVVDLMVENGAEIENIVAAVGPCIAQESYEVDENFYSEFLSKDKVNKKYFINGIKNGFYQFDLQGFCVDELKKAGIKNIDVANHDTYKQKYEYFSFRRDTHEGIVGQPKDFATQLSVIVL